MNFFQQALNHLKIILLALSLALVGGGMDAQSLVGYWQNWGGNHYIPLDQVDTRYNVINLAFAVPASGTDYQMTFSPCCESMSTFTAKIAAVQAQGRKVVLSIGGGGTVVKLDNATERTAFVNSMNSLIDALGVDGIDIDLESQSLQVSTSSTIANPTDAPIIYMIEAIQQIRDHYLATHGKKMFLGFAPETAFVQGGQSWWGQDWGSYLPLLHALRNDVDLLYVQLYNSGTMYGINGGIYSEGTADFIVSQTEAAIHGFNVQLNGFFPGFPEEKVAVGLPACPLAAVTNSYITPAVVKSAVDYLKGVGPKPGSYTLQYGPYPNLGGMMTWSVNWDATADCTVANEFADNYELMFAAPNCLSPNLGDDLSSCDVSFPYTLQSSIPTNGSTTFSWYNETTSQTLVSNSTTANTWSIAVPGTYRVSVTNGSCTRSDAVTISSGIPTPALSGPSDLCGGTPVIITATNSTSYPSGTAFQWYRNQQAIGGETSATITSVTEDGEYTLEATIGTCLMSSSITLDTDLPTAVNDCVGTGQSAMLSLQNAGAGPYNWYDAPTGGSVVTTGTTYQTPALDATTTYYVQDQGQQGNITTGPPVSGNGLGTFSNYNVATNEMYFNAEQSFTLKEVTVFPLIYGYEHPFEFDIRNSSGTLLANGTQSFSITHPGPYGAPIGQVRLTLNNGGVYIPAGTGYKIIVTSSVLDAVWTGVSFPVSYSPYLTVTGGDVSGHFMAFHDWLIESAGCAVRVPVTATVDANCVTLPVEWLSFEAKAEANSILLEWKTNEDMRSEGYTIERRTEEGIFEPLGWQPAAQIQNAAYIYRDHAVASGVKYYYRLAQKDVDGSVHYSPIRSARIPIKGDFMIYPNPAWNEAQFYASDDTTGSIDIQVIQWNGAVVGYYSTDEHGYANLLIRQLPAGVYTIRVSRGAEYIGQTKLVKVNEP